jgi:hypothetical protein
MLPSDVNSPVMGKPIELSEIFVRNYCIHVMKREKLAIYTIRPTFWLALSVYLLMFPRSSFAY